MFIRFCVKTLENAIRVTRSSCLSCNNMPKKYFHIHNVAHFLNFYEIILNLYEIMTSRPVFIKIKESRAA